MKKITKLLGILCILMLCQGAFAQSNARDFAAGVNLGYDDTWHHVEGSGFWTNMIIGASQQWIESANTSILILEYHHGDVWQWNYPGAGAGIYDWLNNYYIPGCQNAVDNNIEPEYNRGKIQGAWLLMSSLQAGGTIEETGGGSNPN